MYIIYNSNVCTYQAYHFYCIVFIHVSINYSSWRILKCHTYMSYITTSFTIGLEDTLDKSPIIIDYLDNSKSIVY